MRTEPQRMTSKQYRDMVASKGRRRGNPTAGANKTEQEFKVWRVMLTDHLIKCDIMYEAIKLRIGKPGARCWYTPDYWEVREGIAPILWDVKARGKDGKPRVEDDALVKIKAAAEAYGHVFEFAIAWPAGNGGWDVRWF